MALATAGVPADAKESVMAGRRRAVLVGLVAAALGAGAAGAAPVWADDAVEVNDWETLDVAFTESASDLSVRLTKDITTSGTNGLVVPPGKSRTVDLAGHVLTISAGYGPGVEVELTSALTILDSAEGGGGVLSVSGAFGAAGIGGDFHQDAGTVTVLGAKVVTIGSEGGAGIGGGADGYGGAVVINGGIVKAVGSPRANGNGGAGIGSGAMVGTTALSPGTLAVAATALPGSAGTTGGPGVGSAAPDIVWGTGRLARVDVTAAGSAGSVSVALTAKAPPRLTLPDPGTARVGDDYRTAVTATGDPVPELSVTGGALPDGLSLDPETGAIRGTPTTAGTFSARVTAGSTILGLPVTDSAWLTITVQPAATPADPPAADPPAADPVVAGPAAGDAPAAGPSGTEPPPAPTGDVGPPNGRPDDGRAAASTVPESVDAAAFVAPAERTAGGALAAHGSVDVPTGQGSERGAAPPVATAAQLGATGADPRPLLVVALGLTAAGVALVSRRLAAAGKRPPAAK